MATITYGQLLKQITALQKDILRSGEAIRARGKQIDEEAQATARDAEAIAALRVDKATVAETRELAKIMAGLSEDTIAYVTAGNTTVKAADAAFQQAMATHNEIKQMVSRSPVGPDIYDLNREWLRQE